MYLTHKMPAPWETQPNRLVTKVGRIFHISIPANITEVGSGILGKNDWIQYMLEIRAEAKRILAESEQE